MRRVPCLVEVAYLVLSMACSVWYLSILFPYLQNDFFWTGFSLHAQTYLLDLYRTCNTPSTRLEIQASYPRALLSLHLTSPALRSVDWAQFTSRFGPSFMFSVGDAVFLSPHGATWLESVQDGFVSIDDEAALWHAHGLSHYTVQWGNSYVTGLHETIAIQNAFGWTQWLSSSKIAYATRDALWTTSVAY
ncbi:hypothetical protein SPRG_17385 [Saprolegnia parasitica CBS 223.65]|uniref:Uncharacterized protein n=1 Tax=Saprolegnia parasitica (strain CBS 223.65) TaxID=695850 RepID=A0A067BKI7_SAPPC|nr:hypothetical protein SPRG_17385 [Saprolegnia parasitica CBS 223.65]KDO17210.1 hypothetical protein SPRG_17385 [Saprolegnia parasitica CBS 223.65]|eukprot:XP_012212084.1 hypothetical protein SPRG_17385 [Saprolegnia parasitica CBS 223.65]